VRSRVATFWLPVVLELSALKPVATFQLPLVSAGMTE
jgi:hypothetical protein